MGAEARLWEEIAAKFHLKKRKGCHASTKSESEKLDQGEDFAR